MSKRFSVLTLALALAIVAPLAIGQEKKAGTESSKAPRLTLVEPVKDFGTVPKGKKIDWTFEITNSGNADLEILAAKPTCGCTVADFDKVIKPGQSGKLTAHVDTAQFGGPITKAVTIETNDPNAPTAQVTINAVVKPYVDAFPAGYVRFNLVQGGADKKTITLFSDEETPFEILKIDSPHDWIKAEFRKAEGAEIRPKLGRAGQNQYIIDITAGGPDTKPGPLAEKLRIQTNSKYQPEFMVSVAGVVRPSFMVQPSGVNFGDVQPAETGATRTIMLRSNDVDHPEAFVVSKAESGVAGVTAAVKPTENKGEYEVTLQLAKDAKPGNLDGSVLIHTSDKSRPVVTIPVKGTVKAAAEAPASGASK